MVNTTVSRGFSGFSPSFHYAHGQYTYAPTGHGKPSQETGLPGHPSRKMNLDLMDGPAANGLNGCRRLAETHGACLKVVCFVSWSRSYWVFLMWRFAGPVTGLDRESHGVPGAARSASKLRPLPTGWPSAQWPSKNSKLLKCQEAAVNYIPSGELT